MSLRIDVVTLFPAMFRGPFDASIVARARQRGLVEIGLVDLRPFGIGPHRITDDYPYGGGQGMVMRPEPLIRAVEWCLARVPAEGRVIVTAARGWPLRQAHLEQWSLERHLVIVAGHYEGIDQRVVDILGAEEISLGDFVLTGGELPAMTIVDGVVRLLPGALGDADSARQDSFSGPRRLLEGPQYTRPPVFRGYAVPAVLQSGDHGRIAAWRADQALRTTAERRPQLLSGEQENC